MKEMKSRTELVEMANHDNPSATEAVTLLVLLDIRDLLVEANKVVEIDGVVGGNGGTQEILIKP